MEPPRERPWTEHEKVFLLAEIIKAAPISSDYLLRIIRESGIQPKWFEMPLPYGRTVQSCQMTFDQLLTGRLPMYQPPGYQVPPQSGMQGRVPPSELPKKRPLAPETSTPNPMGRIIQPRPPPGAFQAVDPLRPSSGYPSSVGSGASSISGGGGGGEPATKKKRGRPTKAEQQARAAAAAARGEVIPPLSRGPGQEQRPTQYTPELAGRQSLGMQGPPSMVPGLASPIGYPPTPTARTSGLAEAEQEPSSAGQRSRGSATSERPLDLPPEAPSSAGAEESPARSGLSTFERSQSSSSHGQTHTGAARPPSHSTYEPRSGSLPLSKVEESQPRMRAPELEPSQSQDHPSEQQPIPPTQQPQPQQQQQQQQQQGSQQRTTPHSFKETVGM